MRSPSVFCIEQWQQSIVALVVTGEDEENDRINDAKFNFAPLTGFFSFFCWSKFRIRSSEFCLVNPEQATKWKIMCKSKSSNKFQHFIVTWTLLWHFNVPSFNSSMHEKFRSGHFERLRMNATTTEQFHVKFIFFLCLSSCSKTTERK